MVIVRGTKAQSSLRHKLRKKSMKFRHFKFGIVAIAMVILTNWLPINSFGIAPMAPAGTSASTMAGVKAAKWGSNVKLSYVGNNFTFASNGIPNHSRPAEYVLPTPGVRELNASTAYVGADPTEAQTYNFTIPLNPTKSAKPTSTSLGAIGVMISGSVLFNPYEGDGKSIATLNNFTLKNSKGQDVAFLDSCNGHPTPMGVPLPCPAEMHHEGHRQDRWPIAYTGLRRNQ
jgi:hypothetical protein